MSDLTPALCHEAALVASSFNLKILYGVRLALGIIGMICIALLQCKKGTSWIPNRNAKLLYQSHVYLCFHICFFFSMLYGYQIVRTSISSENPCHYAIDARISALIRLAPGLGIHFQTFNMFTFTLERAVSTICPMRYEKVSNNYFGIFLVILAGTVTVVLNLFCVYLPIKGHSYVSLLTARNLQNMDVFQLINNLPLCVEFATLFIFSCTYFLNRRKSRKISRSTLGNRYQIAENKKVIGTLLPCFVVHCALNLFSYGALSMFPILYPDSDIVRTQIWTEIISQAQTYSIVLPIIVFFTTKKKNHIYAYNPETAADLHFRNLNDLFDRVE